jgi:hypothetical protein
LFLFVFNLVVPLQACMKSGAQLSRAALDNGTDAQVSYRLLAGSACGHYSNRQHLKNSKQIAKRESVLTGP